MKYVLAALALAYLPFAPQADTHEPDREKREFVCHLLVSIDPSVVSRWYCGTRASIPTVSSIVAEQEFSIYPLFRGYGRGDEDQISIRFDLEVFGPDGASKFRQEDLVGADENAVELGPLLLAADILTVGFDAETMLGQHTVRVTARDLIGGTSTTAEVTVELLLYREGASFETNEDFKNWLYGFRRNPDPRRAIPALLASADWLEEGNAGLERGFFRELLAYNTWLFPFLVADYGSQTKAARNEILWQLSRTESDVTQLLAELPTAARSQFKKLASEATDPLIDPIAGRVDLNEIWGRYLTYRNFGPLRRMVAALDVNAEGTVADEIVSVEGSELEAHLAYVVGDVCGRMLERALNWDETAREYYVYILDYEELTSDQERRLKEALGD